MDAITSKQGHLADQRSSCSFICNHRRLYRDRVNFIKGAKEKIGSSHIYFIRDITPAKGGSVF